mgnify:CR=1 FL=1
MEITYSKRDDYCINCFSQRTVPFLNFEVHTAHSNVVLGKLLGERNHAGIQVSNLNWRTGHKQKEFKKIPLLQQIASNYVIIRSEIIKHDTSQAGCFIGGDLLKVKIRVKSRPKKGLLHDWRYLKLAPTHILCWTFLLSDKEIACWKISENRCKTMDW